MKQEFDIIKLSPKSSFHFGEHGIGLEATATFIRSDTLASAIISTWAKFYGGRDLKTHFSVGGAPPFLISSAFPYAKEVYFLPRPMIKPKSENEDERDEDEPDNIRKDLKKATLISKAVFDDYIADDESRALPLPNPKNLIQKKQFQVDDDDRKGLQHLKGADDEITIFSKQEVPRVTLDRITNSSNIFYFARITFNKGCGYFFLIKYLDGAIKKKLRAVLRLLGEQGISGDRSSGHGRFVPEFINEKMRFDVPEGANHFITLSLLYPTQIELQNGLIRSDEVAYDFVVRDGYFLSAKSHKSNMKRRQKRRMFTEGSVFRGVPNTRDEEIVGEITDVTPPDFTDHPVLRWGIGFPIGVKL